MIFLRTPLVSRHQTPAGVQKPEQARAALFGVGTMLKTLRVNPRFFSWASKTECSYTRNGGGWQGKGTQLGPQIQSTGLHVPATAAHGERGRLGKRKSRMEEIGKASTMS